MEATLSEQTRLSILCCDPRPKRGSPKAITRQYHVADFRGCATLFNKDTFEPGLQITSIYVLLEQGLLQWVGVRISHYPGPLPTHPQEREFVFH